MISIPIIDGEIIRFAYEKSSSVAPSLRPGLPLGMTKHCWLME